MLVLAVADQIGSDCGCGTQVQNVLSPQQVSPACGDEACSAALWMLAAWGLVFACWLVERWWVRRGRARAAAAAEEAGL